MKHDDLCESEMTSHGLTECRCAERILFNRRIKHINTEEQTNHLYRYCNDVAYHYAVDTVVASCILLKLSVEELDGLLILVRELYLRRKR